jgi:[CysO sulfur-carrier protein]-S-L-cysteine hydrolase
MRLTREHTQTMLRHAYAGLPNEACGVLAGRDNTVTAVHCLENADRSPTTYELTDDGYLLVVALEDEGHLLASFHSHPHGPAYPSATDRRLAFWPIRYVVISLANRERPSLRAFRIIKSDTSDQDALGEVVEEELEIVDAIADT